MLFHEIYGSYFNVVADVLREACGSDGAGCGDASRGTLNDKRLYEIIREKGFGESSLGIPGALKGGEWSLLTSDMKTPVKHPPAMPLTLLQKRWLKALLDDPRVRLFTDTCDGRCDKLREGLEDVEQLYTQDTFYYFDRYSDGDPFEDADYAACFRRILTAIKEKRFIDIYYLNKRGNEQRAGCFPCFLEYSSKDDKFRLIAAVGDKRKILTINVGRVFSVEILKKAGAWVQAEAEASASVGARECSLTMDLVDERNALDRAMLHFSHLKKETVRVGDRCYKITLHYNASDETEMLIRVLAFGPMLRVTAPDRFVSLIRERLEKQKVAN